MTSAKLIQVIVTESTRGQGTDGSPMRCVTTYWTPDGKRLAEVDGWQDEKFTELRVAGTELSEALKRKDQHPDYYDRLIAKFRNALHAAST